MRIYRQNRESRGSVLTGCLVALGVLVLLLVIGGVIVAMNWRSWTARGMHSVVEAGLSGSTLPVAEQDEIMAVVDGFTAEFKAGAVSASQFGQVFKELAESPILPSIVVAGVNADYIVDSELSDEEKAAGAKDLSRFVQGIYTGDISQTKIDDVTEPIHAPLGSSSKVAIHAGNVNVELKQSEDVTTAELQQFLANAKAEADKAGVADELFEIDWSVELQAVIDRALGRAPVLPEPPAEEPDAGTPDEEGGDSPGGG